jgi:hypothetical protein
MRLTRRSLALGLATLVAGVVFAAVVARLGQPSVPPFDRLVSDAVERPATALRRVPDGRLWFVGDALFTSQVDQAVVRSDGSPVDWSATLFLLNVTDATARVSVRIYRAHAAAGVFTVDVPPGALHEIDLTRQPEVPRDEHLWFVVAADRPVIPQLVHATHRPWDPVPETLTAQTPEIGPLDVSHAEWVFPDGFQGGTESWFEDETLTLLNPSASGGRARLSFRFRDNRAARVHDVELPAERVTVVELWRLFPEDATPTTPAISGDHAITVGADVPVVTRLTRRARWRGTRAVEGMRTLVPTRRATADSARTWHYAGGWITNLGVLPRDNYADRTWQLLFTYGLHTQGQTVRLEPATGRGGLPAETVTLESGHTDLQWLHVPPWRDRLGEDSPWALTLHAEAPIVPSISAAEFAPWSQAMPGAMAAATLVPGPLTDEREWWLGVARHGGSDEEPVEWEAAWQLFNPGTHPLRVALLLRGPGVPIAHAVDVAPGAVVRVTGDDVPGLAPGQAYFVKAEAAAPFVAHAWQRVRARGVPGTRALVSAPGVPIAISSRPGDGIP